MKKFREKLLLSEMEHESKPKPINAQAELVEDKNNFDVNLKTLRDLGKCFWRFEQS